MTNDRFDAERRDPERLDRDFERDLRATLERVMAAPAPATLRARVERTLASPDGVVVTRNPRRRLAWLGAALALAILAAVPLAVNLATRQSAVVAQPSPSAVAPSSPYASPGASSSPEGASPSASPSGPTAAQIGLPVVSLSTDVVRKTRVDTADTGARAGGPLTGPYLYDLPSSGTGTTRVTDIGGGSIRIVDPKSLPLGRDEVPWGFLRDSSWMAMLVVPSNLNDCRAHPTVPMPWRIEVAAMGPDGLPAGAWREIASGAEASKFGWIEGQTLDCAYAYPPVLALSGDLLAWSSSSSAALDAGSNVTVVSLATSATVASYRSAMRVVQLELSADAIAWVEATNKLVTSAPQSWAVMEARLSEKAPFPVDLGVTPDSVPMQPQILLDGRAVVAGYNTVSGGQATGTTLVRVDGGHVETISSSTSSIWCNRLYAADTGRVVLGCDVTSTPGGTSDRGAGPFLMVWTKADGLRTVTLADKPIFMPPEVHRTGDWITWFAIDWVAAATQDNAQGMPGDWMAIPIDALAAPAP